MGNLYLMCGIPGSGKSTYAKMNKDLRYCKYISRDDIRYSLLKDGDDYFSKEKQVFRVFITQINQAIIMGRDVVVDATHISRASRARVLRNLEGRCNLDKIVCICMTTPLLDCLQRNAMRSGRAKVPDKSIKEMAHNFEKPSYDEGFDEIIFV